MPKSPSILSPDQLRSSLSAELALPPGVRLPSPPGALLKIQRLFRDPNLNFIKLADAIALDPATSASVLRLARSPLFGLRRQPRTLVHAVASIGMVELERMVVTQVALNTLTGSSSELHSYLRDAYGTALVTRTLCRRHEPLLDPGLAWPAGLLFDIGKLVRLSLYPEQDVEIRRAMLAGQCSYASAEASLSLTDQHFLGASLLYKWQLPMPYVEVALYGGRQDPLAGHGTHESLILRRIVSAAASLLGVTLNLTSTQERTEHRARAQVLLRLTDDAFLAEMAVIYDLLPTIRSLL